MRVGVAHAGNDHRLGAQEAPPAIISLYTGTNMEAHIQAVVAGGPLEGYGGRRVEYFFGDGRRLVDIIWENFVD